MENKAFIINLLSKDNTSFAIREELPRLLSVIPELEAMMGFEHQHPHHHLNVWEHTLLAIDNSANRLEIRLALLLHDIGKPHSYQQEGAVRHYRGHAEKSCEIAKSVLQRLDFDTEKVGYVCEIIKKHDTFLTESDMQTNFELSKDIFEVQRCDALAHNPLYNEKRLAYIERTADLLGRYTIDGCK